MTTPMRGCSECSEPLPLNAFGLCDDCATGQVASRLTTRRQILAAALLVLLVAALVLAGVMRGAGAGEHLMDGDAAYPQGIER